MGDIQFSQESSVLQQSGQISTSGDKENFSVAKKTNHNEIRIMEENWEEIRYKIGQIDLSASYGVSSIIIGAAIPYTIDIVVDVINQRPANYMPLALCGILYGATQLLSRRIPALGDGKMRENQVHLDDIKRLVEKTNNVDE